MLDSPGVVLLVAREGDRVAGFVSGAVAPASLYREFLRRHGVRAAAILAGRAVRPSVAARMLETIRELRRGRGGPPSPELLSIAVDPGHRRSGIGSLLIRALDLELRARGADHVVVVVGARNVVARALYERHGFSSPETVEVHRGIPSIRYRKDLRTAAGPDQ
jgi:ribosomal protein S18 acetylase RimI-like enzyme